MASLPVYYFPSVIRGAQLHYAHQNQGNPDGSVSFVGPFGMHPVAAARMGLSPSDCLDSIKAFHSVETLWLDYFCTFKDSSAADLAIIYGGAYVNKLGNKGWAQEIQRIEIAKQDIHSSFRASYPYTDVKEVLTTEDQGPNLAAIPKFETYTVKAGDSLWKIHQKFPQYALTALMEANGGRETIYVGQKLQISL